MGAVAQVMGQEVPLLLWHSLWVLLCLQHSVSQSPRCQAKHGLCRNPWTWPIQENVPSLSLFKAKQELFLKESSSQTPIWWFTAEIPGNLQLVTAEGHTRWAYSFLLPQSLRNLKAPVRFCCSPHMAAVAFPYSARPKNLLQQWYSLTHKVDFASTSSQS